MAQRVTVHNFGTFTVTLPNIPLVVPEAARAVVDEISRDHVELALATIAGYVSEEAPRNFGILAQSFLANPSGPTGGIELLGAHTTSGIVGRVFTSLPYAIVMEEGRRPGYPVSRAGIAAIGLWVRRKLGLSGREAKSATYAIAWTIQHRGIQGKRFAAKGFANAQGSVDALFEQMAGAIEDALTKSK